MLEIAGQSLAAAEARSPIKAKTRAPMKPAIRRAVWIERENRLAGWLMLSWGIVFVVRCGLQVVRAATAIVRAWSAKCDRIRGEITWPASWALSPIEGSRIQTVTFNLRFASVSAWHSAAVKCWFRQNPGASVAILINNPPTDGKLLALRLQRISPCKPCHIPSLIRSRGSRIPTHPLRMRPFCWCDYLKRS